MRIIDAALAIDSTAHIEPVLMENGKVGLYVYASEDDDAEMRGLFEIDEGPTHTNSTFDPDVIRESIAFARAAWRD